MHTLLINHNLRGEGGISVIFLSLNQYRISRKQTGRTDHKTAKERQRDTEINKQAGTQATDKQTYRKIETDRKKRQRVLTQEIFL